MDIFNQKVIVITGAGSGLGKGISEALGTFGAYLVLSDINIETVQQVGDIIIKKGGHAIVYQTDTSDYTQVQSLINNTLNHYGKIDYLYNNAGIGIAGEFQYISIESWHKVLNINLMGMVYGCEIAYKIMVKQGFGHIINTASLAGLIPFPTAVPYATSKMAVVGLSKSLRIEGEKLGVKVTAICPGFVQTGIYESAIKQVNLEQLMSAIILPIISVDEATKSILKGVVANKELIVFPFYSKLLHVLIRFFPIIGRIIGRDAIKKLRRIKI